MVQVIPADDPYQIGAIGHSIGSSLGQALGQNYRNKALNNVLKDVKAYREANKDQEVPFDEESFNIRQKFGPDFQQESEQYLADSYRQRQIRAEEKKAEAKQRQIQDYLTSLQGNSKDPKKMEGESEEISYADLVQNPLAKASDQQLQAGLFNDSTKAFAQQILEQRKANAKINEEPLREIFQSLRDEKNTRARLDRLIELEKEGKFPSATLTALFSKDGDIHPVQLANATPQVQEYVKIIQDMLAGGGVKEAFGSRLNLFEVQQYKKKLPSLLQSPEGRKRIVRDLKLMNEANVLFNEGIRDTYKELGGTNRIPVSEAIQVVEEKLAPRFDEIRKQYIEGPKVARSFEALPSAKTFGEGKKIKDNEKGIVYKVVKDPEGNLIWEKVK